MADTGRPVVFQPGATCPTGYLCIPGMEPIKLPNVQSEPTGPWWAELITPDGGGWEPSSWYAGMTDAGESIQNLPFVDNRGYFASNFPGPWPAHPTGGS